MATTKKPAEEPAAEAERPKQSKERITEGQVPEIQRLVPEKISEADRTKLNLWQKRARIIEELGTIPKRGYNAFHKYAYALEADMVAYIGPLMAKYNLVVDVSVMTVTDEAGREVPNIERIPVGEKLVVTRLPLRITLVNGDKPDERTEIVWVGEGGDTGDKGVYKSYTGALKFFYMKTFMVATGDDPEAFERTDEIAEQGARPVKVAASAATQPEKGGRQTATTAVQIRSVGAMSRVLNLGGDQGDRSVATAEYVDAMIGTKFVEQMGDLVGEAAEKRIKELLSGLPGEETGKLLQQMNDDAAERAAATDAEQATAEAETTDEAAEAPGEGYGS